MKFVIIAIEEREDGAIVLHPPAPAEPRTVDREHAHAQLRDLLHDETLPTVEHVNGGEARLESALTQMAEEALPTVLKPLAPEAISVTKRILSRLQRKPGSFRAPRRTP